MSNYHGGRRHAVDEERRKWQDPEAILAEIGLKPGFTFMDIGCGGGFFALPAARFVGISGKVYGLDADAESITELRDLADHEGLRNMELVVGKAEEVTLCAQCADIMFFGIVLHDFQDPAKVLENSRRMIKPAGRLIDLDWKKEALGVGPPSTKRFSDKYGAELIEAAGFRVTKIKDVGPYHYLIVAEP